MIRYGTIPALAAAALFVGAAQQSIDPAAAQNDQPGATSSEATQIANPLWAVTLTSLSVTRERPIFSPSRRPPQPPAIAAPPPAKPPPPPPPAKAAEPERPSLTLVGTIAGSES